MKFGLEEELIVWIMKTSITQIWMVCHLLPFAKVGQHRLNVLKYVTLWPRPAAARARAKCLSGDLHLRRCNKLSETYWHEVIIKCVMWFHSYLTSYNSSNRWRSLIFGCRVHSALINSSLCLLTTGEENSGQQKINTKEGAPSPPPTVHQTALFSLA